MPVSDPWTLYAEELAALRRQKASAVAAGDTAKAARIQEDIDDFLSDVIPTAVAAYDATNDCIPVRRASDGSLYELSVATLRANLFGTYNVQDYGAAGDGVADDAAEIQAAIDAAEAAGGGMVYLPEGTYKTTAAIVLKTKVQIIGAGPFATVITCTGVGVSGIQSTGVISGALVADLQLVGRNAATAGENGLSIVGDASGGAPKLVLRNLLVKQFGAIGVLLQDCFDCSVEDVNASSNFGAAGLHIVNCFAGEFRKLVAYQNEGHGFHIQSAAGSTFSGDAQENKKNGLLIETAKGCAFNFYLEQNGWSTATDAEKAQLRITQRAGGYKVSTGNRINVFALGGKGSTLPTMESKYGVYVDYGTRNEIGGTYGGHLTSDLYFTGNSVNNRIAEVEYETGLAGGDTPTPITNNGTMNGYSLVSTVKNERIETLSFASQAAARSITFAKAFTAAPKIVGTVVSSVSTTDMTVKISNLTATGFDFVVTDGAALVNGAQVHFIAVGA